jgi:hypothetical protein
MSTSTVHIHPTRGAVYYPYAHIRDPAWFKATLLCFPQIVRMVPDGYPMNASMEKVIESFESTAGPLGSLLVTDRFNKPHTLRAQQWLAKKVRSHADELTRKYSRTSTEAQFGKQASETQSLHQGKLGDLYEELLRRELCWIFKETPNWVYMHPDLNNAVMATLATRIAANLGCDVVSSSRAHQDLVEAQDPEHLFVDLLERGGAQLAENEQRVDRLAELVITMAVDPSDLTAEQIAAIVSDHSAFQAFKDEVAKYAATIPSIPDPAERARRQKLQAEQIVAAWEKWTNTLKHAGGSAIIKAGKLEWPKVAEHLATFSGAATASVLFSNAQLGIGLTYLAYEGYTIYRDYRQARDSGPLRYLSSIAASKHSLHVPAGQGRIGVLRIEQ